MRKTIQILFLTVLPTFSFCQENSDALFVDMLTQLSRSKNIRSLIGASHNDRNAMFFHYGNLQLSYVPENNTDYSIHLWDKSHLFDKPVSCYMSIDSLGQKGSKFYVYFKLKGEGNSPCSLKTGKAKMKRVGEAKLELKKIKIS